MNIINKATLVLVLLLCLTPIGIYMPKIFNATSAWGEWSLEEINTLIGYVPYGMDQLSTLWNAPFPDYNFPESLKNSFLNESFGYLLSGILGTLGCIILTSLWFKVSEIKLFSR